MNLIFSSFIKNKDLKTATPGPDDVTEFIVGTWQGVQLQCPITINTKFTFNGQACQKSDLKPGYKLVIDGRPALTVQANNYTRPAA